MLAALSTLRRHIPSLVSLAAVAAQPFVDLHCAGTADNRQRISAVRGCLPQILLDSCDDLYGDLADDPVCHTGDLAWIRESFAWIERTPVTFRHAESLVSFVEHITIRPSEEAAVSGALLCLTRCTELVVRHFPELLQSYLHAFEALVKRAIARYGAASALLTRITKAVLGVSVPLAVRDILETLHPLYITSVNSIMSEIVNPFDLMLFGINAGRVDLAKERCWAWMLRGDLDLWLYAACYCGDLGVLSDVMRMVYSPQVTEPFHVPGSARLQMLRIALNTSNVDLVDYVFDRTVGEMEGTLADAWCDVKDVACAKELVKRGYPLDGSIERCVRSVEVLRFLLANGAECVPYAQMCAFSDYGPDVLRTLVDAWCVSGFCFKQYLSVAVYQCTCPHVLRTLIREVNDSVGPEVLMLRGPYFLLNGLRSFRTVSYIKACLMLGVPVDDTDCRSGRTVLDFAREMNLPYAVNYLIGEADKCVDDMRKLSLNDW